jgi:TrmH family RNA methyltransferase
MMQHTMIQSRDNAFVKELRRLSQDSTAYRKQGQVWLEGDHLCRAALARGLRPKVAVFAESFWPQAPAEWVQAAGKAWCWRMPVCGDQQPGVAARMGYVMDWDAGAQVQPGVATVVLDRVQDAGNVGSILRSAAAFGFGQIVALKGTAALWSQKVLRAGMGAHFGLHLVEAASVEEVQALQLPLVVTSSHQGTLIHEAACPGPAPGPWGMKGRAWAMR